MCDRGTTHRSFPTNTIYIFLREHLSACRVATPYKPYGVTRSQFIIHYIKNTHPIGCVMLCHNIGADSICLYIDEYCKFNSICRVAPACATAERHIGRSLQTQFTFFFANIFRRAESSRPTSLTALLALLLTFRRIKNRHPIGCVSFCHNIGADSICLYIDKYYKFNLIYRVAPACATAERHIGSFPTNTIYIFLCKHLTALLLLLLTFRRIKNRHPIGCLFFMERKTRFELATFTLAR